MRGLSKIEFLRKLHTLVTLPKPERLPIPFQSQFFEAGLPFDDFLTKKVINLRHFYYDVPARERCDPLLAMIEAEDAWQRYQTLPNPPVESSRPMMRRTDEPIETVLQRALDNDKRVPGLGSRLLERSFHRGLSE